MKKVLSVFLVLALMLSMMPTVFAAETAPTVTVTTDKTALKAGDSITLTLTIDKAVENLMNFEFVVYFDDTVYTKTGSSIGPACYHPEVGNVTVVGDKVTIWGRNGLRISALSTLGDPFTLDAGMIATVTFTANENITAENAGLEVETAAMNDYDTIEMIEGGVNLVGGNIAVTVVEDSQEGYTVSMGDDKTVTVGEAVSIPVSIGSTDTTVSTYNAYNMTFSYDANILTLNMAETNNEGYKVIPGDGTVQILRYGDDAALGQALTLNFTAKSAGSADVKVVSAYVDQSANAIEFDAPAAALTDDTAVVTVTGYTISLPDDFTTDEEDLVVEPGESFTFKPVDANYDYTFSVTVGEDTTEGQTFGNDGIYTLQNITGNVTVTVTEKTPKSFSVTLDEDITGASTATYKTDYTFTLTQAAGYTYNVQVTIGGTAYTGFSSVDNGDGTFTYTIPGADITGAIVINSNKQALPPVSHSVTFTGTGAGDIAEGTETTVNHGSAYTFTLNKAAGYKYTVTATMDGADATVTEGDNAAYTIENVTGDLIINIEKEVELSFEVAVSTYVELDGKTMYLVTVTGTPDEGKTYAYDGNVMYKTTAYGENVYSWLVIAGEGETAPTVESVTAKITLADAEATVLAQTYDVNMTGVVDVNDAQLVYDMYNGKYGSFDTVSVQKFLNADVNSDKTINSADAVAVVNNAN